MQYIEITVKARPEYLDDVAAKLTAAGFSELVIEDGNGFTDFLEENRDYWDYIDEDLEKDLQDMSGIKLYLEETDTQGLDRLRGLLEKAEGVESVTETLLAEQNWEESWKDNYPPQIVGEKLIVLPYWCENTEKDRLPVILDPGLTFGTGAHPSTQMVMEVMENKMRPGMRCLDLGSGSGILSIAALRLGAEEATGIDIDPKAEDIARENVAYNGLQEKFTALTGNVIGDKKLMAKLKEKHWDMVLVNIVADVIVALSPVLPEFLEEDSTLILSGILDTRLNDVLAALKAAGLTATQIRQKEDWRCVCAKRSNV